MSVSLAVSGDSHPGLVHLRNEDSLAIAPQAGGGLLLVVCDGMGGMGRGDQASRIAIGRIAEVFASAEGDVRARMAAAVTEADRTIRTELNSTGRGHAGCTVAMVHVRDDVAEVGWVGDSRAYAVRDGAVIARTKDHKLVQELVDMGQLTPEEAKRSPLSSVITRAIGGRAPGGAGITPSFLEPWSLRPGDRLLLCSDGLADLVSDDEIGEFLAEDPGDTLADGVPPGPAQLVQALIKVACDRGGHDNISVILAAVQPGEVPPDVAAHLAGAVVAPPSPPTPAPVVRRPPPLPAPRVVLDPLSAWWLAVPAAIGVLGWMIVHLLRG